MTDRARLVRSPALSDVAEHAYATSAGQADLDAVAAVPVWQPQPQPRQQERAGVLQHRVAPEHRRRGVAAGLLEAAEERFAALGGSRADAMVLEGNDGAHHLWRAAGYEPQPRWRRWVRTLGSRVPR